ncbi:Uncharacterized protein APZ42_009281, partial [Daphnia magna]
RSRANKFTIKRSQQLVKNTLEVLKQYAYTYSNCFSQSAISSSRMAIVSAILLFCAAGCLAEDLTAEEQYRPAYKSEYPAHRPAYPEPKYPSYSKPSYPSYPSHSTYPAYPKYCDPKAAPKCAENSTGHWCLTDEEYPVYEVKVPLILLGFYLIAL